MEHGRKHASEKRSNLGVKGGTCPLGLPPPLGERGGHPHNCTEYVVGRISTGSFREKLRTVDRENPFSEFAP